jgi:hypothetical protein
MQMVFQHYFEKDLAPCLDADLGTQLLLVLFFDLMKKN